MVREGNDVQVLTHLEQQLTTKKTFESALARLRRTQEMLRPLRPGPRILYPPTQERWKSAVVTPERD
jgi:hypothetical protein